MYFVGGSGTMGVKPGASAFCASLAIWVSLHFVVGLGHVSVAE